MIPADTVGSNQTPPRETVQCFEDLIAWQKARALTRTIYQCTRQGAFAGDVDLSRQSAYVG